MIDIKTGKEIENPAVLRVPLAGPANASVGRGMMRNVGARQMAMFGYEWTNPYVTGGLVAMWDGEWNAGRGIHDNSFIGAIDLTGHGNDLISCATGTSLPTITDDGIVFVRNESSLRTTNLTDKTNEWYQTFQNIAHCLGSFSISMCFLQDSLSGAGHFAGNNESGFYGNGNIAVRCYSNNYGIIISNYGQVFSSPVLTPSVYEQNNWSLTFVFDKEESKIISYYKGVYFAVYDTWPKAGPWDSAKIYDFLIGCVKKDSDICGFDGILKSYRIYDRVLSANEVLDIYNVDKARFNLT